MPVASFDLTGRRVVLGAVLLLVAGLSLSAVFVATPEQCLVGHWRIAESSSFPKAGTLDLAGDGSARITEFQDAPYRALWKSRQDTLEISLVSQHRPDLDQTDPGLSWSLQWKIADRTADSLKLEGPLNGHWPKGEVRLVRE
jgi:hypothetical protein